MTAVGQSGWPWKVRQLVQLKSEQDLLSEANENSKRWINFQWKKWADKITAIPSKNVEFFDKYQIRVRLSFFLPKIQQKLDFHPRSRINGREEVKVTMMQIFFYLRPIKMSHIQIKFSELTKDTWTCRQAQFQLSICSKHFAPDITHPVSATGYMSLL